MASFDASSLKALPVDNGRSKGASVVGPRQVAPRPSRGRLPTQGLQRRSEPHLLLPSHHARGTEDPQGPRCLGDQVGPRQFATGLGQGPHRRNRRGQAGSRLQSPREVRPLAARKDQSKVCAMVGREEATQRRSRGLARLHLSARGAGEGPLVHGWAVRGHTGEPGCDPGGRVQFLPLLSQILGNINDPRTGLRPQGASAPK